MSEPPRHALADLLRLKGFQRILMVRFPSQTADGAFQLGAAALLLFALDPNQATTGWEIAKIIAVTSLPFTVVGPVAGVFIDRWQRRRILVWSNVVRAVVVVAGLAAASAYALDLTGGQTVFYAAVLIALSVNRFFLATLGAIQPRVVPGEVLVPANAIASTGGSIAALVGASIGGAVSASIGDDRGGPEVVVLLSCALFLMSSVAAARFPPASLGPDLDGPLPPLRTEVAVAFTDVREGVQAMLRSRRAWAPIVAFSTLRLLITASSIAGLLVFRNVYGRGSESVAQVLVAFGIGVFVGAVGITVQDRVGRPVRNESAVRFALLLGGVPLLVLAEGLRPWAIITMSGALGVAFGIAKIASDTLIQTALPDRYRGRLFAAYDVIVNLMVALGGVAAAVALPQAERAEAVYLTCGGGLVALAILSRRWLGRLPPPVDLETWEEAQHLLDPSRRG